MPEKDKNRIMIKIDSLRKSYNGKTVLAIDYLEIPKGQSFGLVGNNGAGKTTLFSLMLDLIPPTSGSIVNNNVPIAQSEDWKPFTSAFIDDDFLIGYLTPEEYFRFISDLRGWKQTDLEVFLNGFGEFFHDEILGQRKFLRDLSKGNRKKVGIVASLIGNPEVVILDEPFANLDPSTQIRLKTIIRELSSKTGVTLLVSSHDLNHVTEVCQRIVVLEKGEVVKDLATTPDTLPELERFFAGYVE